MDAISASTVFMAVGWELNASTVPTFLNKMVLEQAIPNENVENVHRSPDAISVETQKKHSPHSAESSLSAVADTPLGRG